MGLHFWPHSYGMERDKVLLALVYIIIIIIKQILNYARFNANTTKARAVLFSEISVT